MTRNELSADGREWLIPAARYKGKHDHLIPLSSAAQEILAAVPKIGRRGWVFTTNGKVPISGFSKFKRDFDAKVLEQLREQNPKANLPRWTPHDLRRTARSLMSRAGVNADHAERCLGHVIGGVRGTYYRHEFKDEKRHAFEALGARLSASLTRRRRASCRCGGKAMSERGEDELAQARQWLRWWKLWRAGNPPITANSREFERFAKALDNLDPAARFLLGQALGGPAEAPVNTTMKAVRSCLVSLKIVRGRKKGEIEYRLAVKFLVSAFRKIYRHSPLSRLEDFQEFCDPVMKEYDAPVPGRRHVPAVAAATQTQVLNRTAVCT